MDALQKQVQWARDTLAFHLKTLTAQIEQHIPQNVRETIHKYAAEISATTTQELLQDVKSLKLTAATGTLAATAVTLAILVAMLLGKDHQTDKKKSKKKKKGPKLTKAQRANKEIQRILDFVEETYVPQIDQYIENYGTLSEEDKEYKFKYFSEMLLKELMKLDGVDVAGNNILRENRKKVIRFVQEHQNRLDKFRAEMLK
ncbi:hypothetical protein PUMCH_003651 [Australozyma saopauloensis]|uniref:BAG domain-containing protein n=1 Tax=Australozyma saopauloensis TaxID=291208 RepID=A0AAX4HDD9_9ASCO|nr:hypothetical protein PUMCH_003651 [[Candida] saopauloensis]